MNNITNLSLSAALPFLRRRAVSLYSRPLSYKLTLFVFATYLPNWSTTLNFLAVTPPAPHAVLPQIYTEGSTSLHLPTIHID